MPNIETMHPSADRLAAYAQGRLDEPEMDEIEQHVSSSSSLCGESRSRPTAVAASRVSSTGTCGSG